MIARPNRLVFRFGRARRGAITIGFAFLAVVAVTILLSRFEFGRFVLISTKFDRAVSPIGYLVTERAQVTNGDMTQIFDAGQQILGAYTLGSTGTVFVSEATAESQDTAILTWQVKASAPPPTPARPATRAGRPSCPAP
jgi:Flp pilus assembly protein TadG